ncbi:expressed unknown protein [Seminavis robusta]|uniref:Uncharacterized protein n=1 Tax=Seminavis robusta TaxID=568900 RepID=A0A9N8DLN5_9STRA|nr:expressed unknown protein [Seminavis robusta]|eukprot:Sro150_g068750.1 n/a (229) ;mRNA; f:27887-28573
MCDLIEDDAKAKCKLKEAGFDPDDCIEAIDPSRSMRPPEVELWHSIAPMTHFCFYGDLPMCQYIHNKGGATTGAGGKFWFPMYAAIFKGNLAVVRWLYENGANEDVLAENSHGISPWSLCWNNSERKVKRLTIGRWLLANGAIQFDTSTLANQLQNVCDRTDHRHEILSWSQEVVKAHDSFQAFLMGTSNRAANLNERWLASFHAHACNQWILLGSAPSSVSAALLGC